MSNDGSFEYGVKVVLFRWDSWRKDHGIEEDEIMRVQEKHKDLAESIYKEIIGIGKTTIESTELVLSAVQEYKKEQKQ